MNAMMETFKPADSGGGSRKRRAAQRETHTLLEMCLTTYRRAYLSCIWAAELLQLPKRRRMATVMPWSGFARLQRIHLHRAVVKAPRCMHSATGANGNPHLGKTAAGEAILSPAIAPSQLAHPEAGVPASASAELNAEAPCSTPTGTPDIDLGPTRSRSRNTAAAAAATDVGLTSTEQRQREINSEPPVKPRTANPGIIRHPVRDAGPHDDHYLADGTTPAALLVARAGTPHLASLCSRRPRPAATAVVARIPIGPVTNIQELWSRDLARLLGGGSWLNDEVVNFYMLLIMRRHDQHHGLPTVLATAGRTAPSGPGNAPATPLPPPLPPRPLAAGTPQLLPQPPLAGELEAPGLTAAASTARGKPTTPNGSPGPVVEGGSGLVAESPHGSGVGRRGKRTAKATTAGGLAEQAAAGSLSRVAAAAVSGRAAAAPGATPSPALPIRDAGGGAGQEPAAPEVGAGRRRPGASGGSGGADAGVRDGSGQTGSPDDATAATGGVLLTLTLPGGGRLSSPAPTSATTPAPVPSVTYPRVYAFNSFFFSKLTAKGRRECFEYGEVRRWTLPNRTRTPDCVLTRDLLLFPINHGDVHWCLAAVWPHRRLLQYFDSMAGSSSGGACGGGGWRASGAKSPSTRGPGTRAPSSSSADWVLDTLLRWLLLDIEDKGVTLGSAINTGAHAGMPVNTGPCSRPELGPAAAAETEAGRAGKAPAAGGAGRRAAGSRHGAPSSAGHGGGGDGGGCGKSEAGGRTGGKAATEAEVARWRRETAGWRLPQQLDSSSCGVFLCTFAELLAQGVPPGAFHFSQADIPLIRKGMAEQILRTAL